MEEVAAALPMVDDFPLLHPISIGVPAEDEFIGNPCISHLFKFFLVSGKIFNTIVEPVMHTEPAPQPIMNGRSPPNRSIESPIVIVIAPIGSVIPIITVTFRTISDSGKFDIFLPTNG